MFHTLIICEEQFLSFPYQADLHNFQQWFLCPPPPKVHGTLCNAAIRPSVCSSILLSVCTMHLGRKQNSVFWVHCWYKTLIGNTMLKVSVAPWSPEVAKMALTLKSLRRQYIHYEGRAMVTMKHEEGIIGRLSFHIIIGRAYRLITEKNRIWLFIFSAHLSTVNCHRRRHIVSSMGDIILVLKISVH